MFKKKDPSRPNQQDEAAQTAPGNEEGCGCGPSCCGGTGGGGEPLVDGDPDVTANLIDSLTAERDQANQKWMRALADFQNFQRRAIQNEQEARRQGVTSVLTSVIPVLDHFDQALGQPTTDPNARQIIEGVKVIRSELIKALELHGVAVIDPKPGDEFNPNRHLAVTQLAAEGIAPGRISATLQVGYALGDRVIRSAQVAVAPTA